MMNDRTKLSFYSLLFSVPKTKIPFSFLKNGGLSDCFMQGLSRWDVVGIRKNYTNPLKNNQIFPLSQIGPKPEKRADG
jgi:hypothetical protein